jgi:hypothetical protein
MNHIFRTLFLTIALSICLAASSSMEVVAENQVITNTAFCSSDIISYWKLDETEGTIYEDFVGENDGVCSTIHDCPDPRDGIVNGAQEFNGNQGIDVLATDDFNWDADSDFSIELWVKIPEGYSCKREVFIGRYAGTPSWWVGCQDISNAAIFRMRETLNNYVEISAGPAINDGEWHHIVAVRDGMNDKMRLYVDGNLEALAETTFTGNWISDKEINIGHYNVPFEPPMYPLHGLLDEIAVYGRTLTLTEIENHHLKGREGQGYCVPVQLTIIVDGNGQVDLDPPEPYILGQLVTLTGQADDGHIFYNWSGDLTGYENPVSITLDQDKSVIATFKDKNKDPVWYTLTVSSIGQGSVNLDPDEPLYLHGTTVSLTAVEQPGWKFDGWQGDLNGDNPQANLLMTDNYSVTAVFTEIFKRIYLPLTMK